PPYGAPLPPPPGGWAPPAKRGLNVGACLMALVFAGSLALNGILFVMLIGAFGGGMQSDGATEVHIQGSRGADRKIAVIHVHGVIASGGSLFGPDTDMVARVIRDLRRVREDGNVVAVILDVNSPGGGITDCDRIHHEIAELRRARPGIRLVSLMRDVAASGGYYVSAPCDRIIAHPTTITGSIGVIMSFMNLQGLFEKIGYREEVIKSGAHKDLGSMGREMTPEEREILQAILMEMYDRFVKVIAEGRKMDEAKVRVLADGRIYSGTQARDSGLVDLIGHFEDAVEEAKRLTGATEVNVIRYQPPPTLRELLTTEARPTPAEQVLAAPLERLAGRRGGFYYLWTVDGR
ncbi:MAG: signal peptide peptidase SppA, partial [Candidatus Brocadiae bacterium]|nr:signal peptide peptidase SppA [Candidatus Brocadiia bacterium]